MSLQTAGPHRDSLTAIPLERIEHLVQQRTNGMVQHLEIRIGEGEIVLAGLVQNYYTKQLATHAVLEAVEGMALTNDIEVV